MSRSRALDVLESLDPVGLAERRSPPPKNLLGQILADEGGRIIELASSHRRRAPRPRRRGWRTSVIALVTVIIVVGALVGASLETGSSSSPRGSSEGRTGIDWRLTAALLGPQYEVGTGNPDAVVGVTCSPDKTCVLSTGYGLDYAGGGMLFVSKDNGHRWQPSALPAGIAATTLASCPTDSWCAVGGGRLDAAMGDPAAKKPMRDPELLVSTDGGKTWVARSVPLPVEVQKLPAYGSLPAERTYWPGEVDAVQCSAPDVCNVLGQAQTNGQGGSGNGDELIFLHTSDSGVHWISQALPPIPGASSYQLTLASGEAETMSCPTAINCTIVATPWTPEEEVAWHTANSGESWDVRTVRSGDFGMPSLSCPDTRVCWLGPPTSTGSAVGPSAGPRVAHLLRSENSGLTWSEVSMPTPPPSSAANSASSSQEPIHPPVYAAGNASGGVSCTSAESCAIGSGSEGIAETNDGGVVWKQVTLPPNVATVLQVSCTVRASCVAIANPISGYEPNQYNGGSLILTNGKDTARSR